MLCIKVHRKLRLCNWKVVVVVEGGTKIRNITDASRPKGRSINCFMKETMDDVCKLMSPNCFCGVTDISGCSTKWIKSPLPCKLLNMECH